MSMPDPSFLSPIRVIKETRTFENPELYRQPDGSPFQWSVTLEAQEGFPRALLVNEKTTQFIEEYGPSGAKTVMSGDGQLVETSETLCNAIALLIVMDKSQPGEREVKYDFPKWAILAARGQDIFQRIHSFAVELRNKAWGMDGVNEKGEVSLKNESAATEANTSEPQASKEDVTQTS